jgi:hypothetical protein
MKEPKKHFWVNIEFTQKITKSIEAENFEQAIAKVKAMTPNERISRAPVSYTWTYTPFKSE